MVESKGIAGWQQSRYIPKDGEPELPPQLSEIAQKSTDDVMTELNRLPFFMSLLDETDGEGGSNVELEALKSLAYDGEPDEIATNFKNQGNDCFKAKQYKNAEIYYTKGLDVNCKVDAINVALYVNRAACNLELKNYRRCIEDCKKALLIDAMNVKAAYRAGKALFAVERYDEAKQILEFGLHIDANNKVIADCMGKIKEKEAQIAKAAERREAIKKEKAAELDNLASALNLRSITQVKTTQPVEFLEGAKLRLEDPKDPESQLIFPAVVLYPTIDEFDYVAELGEFSSAAETLEMLLDRPQEWFADPKHEGFAVKSLECFMETISGGLVKVGKKAPLNKALMSSSPKSPLFDGALRLYVVPKKDTEKWLSKWDKTLALSKRTH